MIVHFHNSITKFSESYLRNSKRKLRRITLAQENHNHLAACYIKTLEKLMFEIYQNHDELLPMILNLWKTYIDNIYKTSKVDDQCDLIQTRALS